MKIITILTLVSLLPLFGFAEDAVVDDGTNRVVLEITVGECEPQLRDRLPDGTAKRLSAEDLAQHKPSAPVLTQRLLLPAKGRVTQELKCDEFTIYLDLEYKYNQGMSIATQRTNSVTGGVSVSYANRAGLLRPSHWNCFGVQLGQPLYLGHIKARAVYLIVGRFGLAPEPNPKKEAE